MTLEEAKKILEKEGFKLGGPGKPGIVSETFTEYESPDVCEAMQVVSSAGFLLSMLAGVFNARKERLKKEYEKNTKAPGSAENRIKEDSGVNPALKEAASQFNDALLDEQAKKIDKQNQEITRLLSLVEKKENSISRLHYEKSVLEKENEALKKGEIPARYFDKALVDEQEEKIKKLEHEKLDILEIAGSCKRISAEQAKDLKRLGKEISKLNGIIHDKNEELKRKTKGCCELITENVDLKKKLSDKNAVLSDVAEELRLSKIREKNLTEVCQKYIKANGELKEKLADKVVDKIDANALKSAESALAYKEKVIDKLTKENNDYKKCVEEFHNKIADMTIGKIDIQNIRLKEKDKEIKELNDKLKSINENRRKELTEKDEVISDLGKELAETKKQNIAVMVDMNAKCLRAARESINDVFESYAAKYMKSTLDDLKEKAYDSFNAKACKLGLVGSKDGNGIFDQLVGVDIAEEGGDRSATIVECGKDIDDVFEEIKRLCQE